MADGKKGTDAARRIWLAGIGAYGKAFEDGVGAIRGLGGSVSNTTGEAFESLADKGEQIEAAAKIKGMQLASKADMFDADDRIKAMRERLSGAVPGFGRDTARLDAIEAKLDSIEAKLDALLKNQDKPKQATTKKPSAKKPSAKKPAAKKS